MMLKEVKGDEMAEIPIMLVGNKRDESRREISEDVGARLASKWGTGYIETSAKNNENIAELFQQLLAMEKRRTLTLINDESNALANKNAAKRRCSIL